MRKTGEETGARVRWTTYNIGEGRVVRAAMKLKGCPTICDEDLRRVEQTYPNQFSRLPDNSYSAVDGDEYPNIVTFPTNLYQMVFHFSVSEDFISLGWAVSGFYAIVAAHVPFPLRQTHTYTLAIIIIPFSHCHSHIM